MATYSVHLRIRALRLFATYRADLTISRQSAFVQRRFLHHSLQPLKASDYTRKASGVDMKESDTSTRESLGVVDILFQQVEASFPSTHREDKWYLTAIGALIGSNKASLCGDLYTYLTNQTRYATSEQRQRLIRRMREAMVKCIILNGIPVCFEAVLSVAAREREEDKDYSFSRKGWIPDKANEDRGLKVLKFLYRDDHAKIMDRFHAHADIPFVSTEISYGLFLADHTILDLQESELVILPAIMCQNLSGPTLWHLRGCIRAGISPEETDSIQQCIRMIADYAQRPIDKVGSVADISDELHNL